MTKFVRSVAVAEIAEWALPRQDISTSLNFAVQLPALQRGVVWSAEQVERLWDSLVRGFPIGCLILCEPEERLAVKPFALQAKEPHRNIDPNPKHLLLDGQQRCTAIAIGFLNTWTIREHYDANFALWVDLEAPESKDVREFVFRLLTQSHPWGYQRQNPGDRLSVSARREAMSEFEDSAQQLGHEGLTFRPGYLPLRFAWPRDAGGPLPVALIMDAIGRLPTNTDDARIWDEIRTDMNAKLGEQFDWIATSANAKPSERRKLGARLLELLQNPTPHMTRLLSGFRRLLDQSDSGFRIPAQLIPRLFNALY